MGSFYPGGGYPALYYLDVSIINRFASCLFESTLASLVSAQTVSADVVLQTVTMLVSAQTVIQTTRDAGGFDPDAFDDVDFDGWMDRSYLDAEIAPVVTAQAVVSCRVGA